MQELTLFLSEFVVSHKKEMMSMREWRIPMPKVREILRLHSQQGLSGRAIARSLSISPSTVSSVLARAQAAGLSWPLPSEFDDEALLESRLFPSHAGRPATPKEPNWVDIHQELSRKGVTLYFFNDWCPVEEDNYSFRWQTVHFQCAHVLLE
jgi:transposase-like protein